MTRAAPARRALSEGQRAARAVQSLLGAAERAAPRFPEIAVALAEPASRLQAAFSSLLLRLAAMSQLGSAPDLRGLARRVSDAATLFRTAGLASPAFVAPPISALADPEILAEWVDPEASAATLAALFDDGHASAPRNLGQVHQELLEVTIERLAAPAARVAPSALWVPLRTLLDEPAATRSRRLQRLAGLPKGDVQRLSELLGTARSEAELEERLSHVLARRVEIRPAGALVVGAGLARRTSGAHYTPEALARATLERALAPLLEGRTEAELLELRVCDPAMGTGDFLEVAADVLGRAVHAARLAEGRESDLAAARSAVAARCLFGVDKDPVAVDCARWTLARMAAGEMRPPDLSQALRAGDALVGSASPDRHDTPSPAFHWHDEFPAIFARGGFDACVGNPPWVAYAGRAAQPLASALARYYEVHNAAFFGYRSLHGLFVRRAAELLRPGGRLGLVLPTSVADLHGYAPVRAAHDALCETDEDLIDFGDGAFAGVFQPCMALTSTRRGGPAAAAPRRTWRLSRTDLDAPSLALLERLEALPRLAPEHFGERGLQSTGDDLSHLKHLPAPEGRFTVPLREGVDVTEFAALPPTLFGDPERLGARLRPRSEYERVDVIIRQTARFPIAARADGVAFRNSLLAGFGTPRLGTGALLAYLNSSLVRFFHFARHRDARQGMPQLKIGHLRALPAVPDEAKAALEALGQELGARNRGLGEPERRALDALVFDAMHLSSEERALVDAWSARNPLPKPRARRR